MANINNELNNIKNAKYGKDVRNSIYQGIYSINEQLENHIEGQEIAEGAIDEQSIKGRCIGENEVNFIKVISDNLFCANTATNGMAILSTTGEVVNNAQSCSSNFIAIEPGVAYTQSTGWEGAFYNKNKEYISGKEYGITTFIAPSEAYYYRYSVNADIKGSEMLVKGEEIPTEYIPFKSKIASGLSIDIKETEFLTYKESTNLFDYNSAADGLAINPLNGQPVTNSLGCVSDFIRVQEYTTYTQSTGWEGAFYSENKEYISGKEYGVTTFMTPKGSYYYRYSVNNTIKKTEMLVKGTTLPDKYTPFSGGVIFSNEGYAKTIYKQMHPLCGKKWVCLGDSLTEKNGRAEKNYHDYIAEETGINVVNLGVSGTGYKRLESSEDGYQAFYQRVYQIPEDADIVTIFGSGNDLALMDSLGTPSDATPSTICGCMNETFKRIFSSHPGIKVGVILPCPWGNYPPHQEGNAMAMYCEALRKVAQRYSIPVLDLYYESNLRPWDSSFRSLYYKHDDGGSVHPDEDGHKILSNKFKMFIQSL